jgi:hypothetical protein
MTSKIEILRQALRDVLAQHQADGTLPTSDQFVKEERAVIERVDGALAGAVDSVYSAARTSSRMDSVDAPARRRPAILVNLASDGCKYGVGEILVGESNRDASRRTVHAFCNQPRVSRSYCAEHERLCRTTITARNAPSEPREPNRGKSSPTIRAVLE